MALPCTVCRHPERQQIDLALLLHQASYQGMAGRFGVGLNALWLHERTCLHSSLQVSKELAAMLSAENLTQELGKWHRRMEEQYAKADAAGDVHAAVATARTGIAAIESFSRVGPLTDLAGLAEFLEERIKGRGTTR